MKSFRTQRLANYFPLQTRTRRDPSSLSQRMLSAFASRMDAMEESFLRMAEDELVLKERLGHEAIGLVYLDEADHITYTRELNGSVVYSYPTTVNGTDGAGTHALTRVETNEELLYGASSRLSTPTSVAYSTLVVWDSSAPATYNTMIAPERLTISVSGSTVYFAYRADRNRLYRNRYFVSIRGLDKNRLPVRERVDVLDDGVYRTRNIFSEVDQVLVEGFDGNVTVSLGQVATPYIWDKYHVGVNENIEGQLKIAIADAVTGAIEYKIDRLKLGAEYRDGISEVHENEEVLAEQMLRTSIAQPINVVDIALHPDKGLLYAVDDVGNVHIYEHGLTTFAPLGLEEDTTLEARVICQPLQPYVRYGETEPIWTFYQIIRDFVDYVEIKRVAPGNVVTYLQADRTTWGATPYNHAGNHGVTFPEESWTSFKFETTYDSYGQWDYYVKTVTTKNETFVHGVSVMVDNNDALVSLTTGIGSPTGIFFAEDGRLVITTASDLNYIQEYKDCYIFDVNRNALILREQYTSVEVIY